MRQHEHRRGGGLWLKLGLACMLSAAAGGCLKVEQLIVLERDGSGRVELKYSIAERAVTQIQAMRRLARELAAAGGETYEEDEATRLAYLFLEPSADAFRTEIERYGEQGVRLVEIQSDTRGAWRHLEMKVSFESLEKLAATEPFKHFGFALIKDGQGNYVFYREPRNRDLPPPPDYKDPDIVKNLAPIMVGFHVEIRLDAPTPVLKTNADRKSVSTAIWEYDFARNPGVLTELQTRRLVAVFSGRELRLPVVRHNLSEERIRDALR